MSAVVQKVELSEKEFAELPRRPHRFTLRTSDGEIPIEIAAPAVFHGRNKAVSIASPAVTSTLKCGTCGETENAHGEPFSQRGLSMHRYKKHGTTSRKRRKR